MKAALLVADSVGPSGDGSKISLLGAGWTTIQAGVHGFPLILLLSAEQEEYGVEFEFSLKVRREDEPEPLATADGRFTPNPGSEFETAPRMMVTTGVRFPPLDLSVPGLHSIDLEVGGDLLASYMFAVKPAED